MLFENVKLALFSIKANKTRSILTMLGMIIGIAAVIAIVSLGDTMRSVFAKEYENAGLGLASVYIRPEDNVITERELFSADDTKAISEAVGQDLSYIGFGSGITGEYQVGRKSQKASTTGLAKNPDAYKKLNLIHGRMFSDTDIQESIRPWMRLSFL